MATLDRIIRARTVLVMSQPFFGSLVLRLELAERPDITETMATDGRRLFYNPAFVDSLSDPELCGVLAHETMHCALRHFARRGGRDIGEWNVATDHAINLDVKSAGFVLPAGVLADPRFRGMSAEDIHYSLFGSKPAPAPEPAPAPADGDEGEADDGDDSAGSGGDDGADDGAGGDGDQSGGDADGAGESGAGEGGDAGGDGAGEDGAGDGAGSNGNGSAADTGAGDGADGAGDHSPAGSGNGRPGADTAPGAGADARKPGTVPDPGRCGGVIEPADVDSADAAELSREWEIFTRQAINAATKRAGSLPGYLQRVVDDLDASRVSWRDVLRRFIDQSASRDYSWMRPNRRHVASGLILPGLVSDSLSRLVVVIDTSGSIDDRTLREFLSEVSGAMDDGAADRLTMVHCDTAVRRVDEFERGDYLDSNLPPVGGGGTKFSPAFEWITDNAADAVAVVYFSDLECYDWGTEPAAPVIWAAWGDPADVRRHAARIPFGEMIHVNPDA